jgi:hypothetical protein
MSAAFPAAARRAGIQAEHGHTILGSGQWAMGAIRWWQSTVAIGGINHNAAGPRADFPEAPIFTCPLAMPV